MVMARPPEGWSAEAAQRPATASKRAAVEQPKARPPRPELDDGVAGWWWVAVCGAVALLAGLAAAFGPLAPAAAAVVVGAAVIAAPARPRRAQAVAAVGALLGLAAASGLERPAALAGVAVAAAVAQLALSPPGRARVLGAGLLVAAVAGALALRAAPPADIGGPLEGAAAGVLLIAALAAVALALPAHGDLATSPTAAVVCSVLAVSALGVRQESAALAGAALLAAVTLTLVRRPAAGLVAAAVACAATPALAAAPLALVAAAAAAALAVPSFASRLGVSPAPRSAWGPPTETGGLGASGTEVEAAGTGRLAEPRATAGSRAGSEAPLVPVAAGAAAGPGEEPRGSAVPAWALAVATLPAGAAALDVAAGRTPSAVLAVAALAAAGVGLTLVDRAEGDQRLFLPLGAWPAAALTAVTLVVPGSMGWMGNPVPHWPAGVGFAALGAAVATLASGRTRSGAPPGGAARTPPAGTAEAAVVPPASALGHGPPADQRLRGRRARRFGRKRR